MVPLWSFSAAAKLSVTFERESSREQSSPPPALPLPLPATPAPVFLRLSFFLSHSSVYHVETG